MSSFESPSRVSTVAARMFFSKSTAVLRALLIAFCLSAILLNTLSSFCPYVSIVEASKCPEVSVFCAAFASFWTSFISVLTAFALELISDILAWTFPSSPDTLSRTELNDILLSPVNPFINLEKSIAWSVVLNASFDLSIISSKKSSMDMNSFSFLFKSKPCALKTSNLSLNLSESNAEYTESKIDFNSFALLPS